MIWYIFVFFRLIDIGFNLFMSLRASITVMLYQRVGISVRVVITSHQYTGWYIKTQPLLLSWPLHINTVNNWYFNKRRVTTDCSPTLIKTENQFYFFFCFHPPRQHGLLYYIEFARTSKIFVQSLRYVADTAPSHQPTQPPTPGCGGLGRQAVDFSLDSCWC